MFNCLDGVSTDLRERVLEYIDAGHSQAMASSLFKLSRQTIDDWINLCKQTGELKDQIRPRSNLFTSLQEAIAYAFTYINLLI
jgi:transposase